MATVRIDDADRPVEALRRALQSAVARGVVQAGQRVFLKPNLTYPVHRPGVTTSPQFMGAALECLTDLGAQVSIGEGDGGYGSWSAETAFDGHGLRRLCRRYGAQLVNLSTVPGKRIPLDIPGRARSLVLPGLLLDETDVFITMPVPKIHSVTVYSGAVKNQWGCIPDAMRLRYHPQFQEMIWVVNRLLAPRLVLADAQYMLDQNGPMVGEPVFMNRVIVGDDILAFDTAVVKQVMGLDPATMPYLRLGRRYGFAWEANLVEDLSTGSTHRFTLHRTLRNKLVAQAFPRQWAVDLVWLSRFGDAMHKVLYKFAGNPVARERERVLAMAQQRSVEQ